VNSFPFPLREFEIVLWLTKRCAALRLAATAPSGGPTSPGLQVQDGGGLSSFVGECVSAMLHDPKLSREHPSQTWPDQTRVPISPPSPAGHVVVVALVVDFMVVRRVCVSGNRKLVVLCLRQSGKRARNTFAAICVALM
jgi:hypothetical protein